MPDLVYTGFPSLCSMRSVSLAAAITPLWAGLFGTTCADNRTEDLTSWAIAGSVEELELALAPVALTLVKSGSRSQ